MLNRITGFVLAMITLLICVNLTGCGSGNTAAAGRSAQVSLRITWPAVSGKAANSRYIPSYASSLFFELYLKSAPDKRYNLIVNRPANAPSSQIVTFSQLLNEGDYVLAGAARSLADGGGATVASAVVNVAVKQGMAPVPLALNSTIKTITILGQPLTVTVGPDVTLQSGAFDPDGNSLLLPNGALKWSVVSGGTFGTLTPAGVLSPKSVGVMRVRLSEDGAGVSAEANVTLSQQNIVAGLANTPYPKENADTFNTNQLNGQGATGHIAWTIDTLSDPNSFIFSTPILGGNGLVYVTTNLSTSTNALALHTSDGSQAWKAILLAATSYSPVALSNNTVVFPMSRTGLIAVDAQTGIERWRNPSPSATASASADSAGHLFVGTRDGLGVFDGASGTASTSYPGLNSGHPAIAADGTIYYVWQKSGNLADGQLVAISPVTHASIWTVDNIETSSTPVIGPNGWVYIIGSQAGTAFNRIAAYDPANGSLKAEMRNVTINFTSNLAFGKDGNLYASPNGLLTSLSPTLQQNWQSGRFMDTGGNLLAIHRIAVGPDSTLYVEMDTSNPTTEGRLYAFSTVDGSEKWHVLFTGRVLGGIAVDTDGTLFIETDTGKVIAIR